MYSRVVYKLSGEHFSDGGSALTVGRFEEVCRSIELLSSLGVEPCVVVGGGNIFRGNRHEKWGISQPEADIAGMMATSINASLLDSMLRARGAVSPVLFSLGPCEALGRKWNASAVGSELRAGRIPLVAGGAGIPLVSTDYPAIGFAKEIGAEAVLMAKSGVDGVYERDPNRYGSARFLASLSIEEALNRDLEVMDRVALLTALEHRIKIHVFSAEDESLPGRVAKGETIGTVLTP